ncbi:hypothetical protein HYW75_01305 [Candidatus Pacearchaeota archaeon]|nr:hypothetical protein [Candidatus Pacearchaeota archaeon]
MGRKGINKILLIIIPVIIMLFIMTYSVGASGLAAPHWDGENANPLGLFIDETRIINFELQNLGSDEDVTFRFEIVNGTEVAQLVDADNMYLVKANDRRKVPVRITAPSGAKAGDTYKVKVEATSVETQKSGQFKFGAAMGASFDVVLTARAPQITAQKEEEKAPSSSINWIIYLIIAIIVIAIIIYFVRKKKK